MSVQEIQAQLTKLTPQQQADIARFLETIRETHSPAFARELAERHKAMDAGRKISEAELARILAAKPAAPMP
jgi:ABC-type polar amino acid transport system ATPase subunit